MKNWKHFTQSITIKGKSYYSTEISSLSVTPNDSFEYKIFDFINLWINDNEYIVQHTSGTTGKPEEIKIHKNVMVFSALNTGHALNLDKKDKSLLCLPVEYIAGKMMIVRAFVLGLDLYYQTPSALPDLSQQYHFSAVTPLQLENLALSSSLNNFHKLIVGGAPVNNELIELIQHYNTEIYETYGMTETASHIALKKLNGKDRSDFFRVLDGIEISTNENSQLIISSDGLKINNLLTKDIVKLIDKNTFQWVGRYDNIINSAGIKLLPENIEMKLKPFIKNDFFIFGLKDKKYNQSPAILIEGSVHHEISHIFEIILTKFEIPKKIFYIEKFIRTGSGKVNRKETLKLLDLLTEKT